LKRGDVWTVAGGPDYVEKPRPAVVIQDESFDVTDSVTICAFTTTHLDAPTFRLEIEPTTLNGLERRSWLMVDKVSSVPRAKLGRRVGQLSAEDVSRLNQALLVFLGLARPVARS
jgi:mRNA interferase MazF